MLGLLRRDLSCLCGFGIVFVLAAGLLPSPEALAQAKNTPKPPAAAQPAVPPSTTPEQQSQPAAPPGAAPQQLPAPQAQPNQPPRQITGTTTGWVKVCQKFPNSDKEGCSIEQQVYAENGAFLASMAVQEVTGEQRRQLLITTPLGMALQAGMLVRVDNEKAVPAKFGTCLVNGCFAGLQVSTDMVNTMKKGQNAFVTVRNIQGAALDLAVPLTTFGKAYDGPAMDVAALQEQQKKLQEELLHRAEKAREELLKQQGQQQQGGTAGAPAKPGQ